MSPARAACWLLVGLSFAWLWQFSESNTIHDLAQIITSLNHP